MGAYEYTALDTSGREHKGVLEGDTARQIRQQLRDRGWAPLAVAEVQEKETQRRGAGFAFRRGVSATDLALLTRQFATLVGSGLPIEEALRAVARQHDKPRIKNMLIAVRSRVMEGHSLATAMQDFPHVFSDLYRATVAAGEQSGYLSAVLERLADYTEARQAMRQKVLLALLYPSILSLVAVLVVTALLTFVVPQVISVFEGFDQELPVLTRGLIWLSELLRAQGLTILLSGLVLAVVATWLLRRPRPKYAFHSLLLRLPLVRRLIRGANSARFARTFSILTASSVPVLEAMRISAQVQSNLPMRDAVEDAARQVREGSNIAEALERTGYFPPMIIHLIASGEASGRLEQMLERAANSQERELESVTAAFLGLFEPVLILVMGGLVLIIVLAILLPIFDLNQLIK